MMLIHFIIRFSTPLSSTLDDANLTRETCSLRDKLMIHPNLKYFDKLELQLITSVVDWCTLASNEHYHHWININQHSEQVDDLLSWDEWVGVESRSFVNFEVKFQFWLQSWEFGNFTWESLSLNKLMHLLSQSALLLTVDDNTHLMCDQETTRQQYLALQVVNNMISNFWISCKIPCIFHFRNLRVNFEVTSTLTILTCKASDLHNTLLRHIALCYTSS